MHQVDKPTLNLVSKQHPNVIGWFPLLHAKDGTPHFNTTRFALSTGEHVSVFAVKPIYYEALGGFWRPLSEICEHHGNRKILLNDKWRMATPRFIDWLAKRQKILGSELLLPTPFGDFTSKYHDLVRPTLNVGLTVSPFFPNPSPGLTTVDGYVVRNGVEESWATIRAGAGNGALDTAANFDEQGLRVSTTIATNWRNMERAIILFDTRAIADTDSIDSGTFNLYVQSKIDTITPSSGVMAFRIVDSTPASNTAAVAADYANVGTTAQATDINIGSISITAYNQWTLNSTGLGNISKTGVTKFGLRHSRDADNSEPTGTHTLGTKSIIFPSSADTATEAEDPKLIIVHSTVSLSAGLWPVTA